MISSIFLQTSRYRFKTCIDVNSRLGPVKFTAGYNPGLLNDTSVTCLIILYKKKRFYIIMTQINGKAVRAILIVLIALMLVMVYPKQAFASECAENSGSSGSIEVTETDETAGNTPSDCSSGDQGQNTALSDGIDTISTATAPADTNPETDCTVPAQTTGSSDTADPVETADTFTVSTPENATSTTDISGSMQDAADPEGNESTHNTEDSENTDTKGTTKDTDGTEIIDPAKIAAQVDGKDLTDGAASPENKDTMASDTQKGAPTEPSGAKKDGASVPPASDIEGAPVKPVKPQNTDDEEHYKEDHNTASEPSGGSGIPTPGQEVYPPGEYGLSELNPDVFAQLNTDNNAEAEFEGNIPDDASVLFIKTGFDNSENADFTGEIGDAPTEKEGDPLSEPAIAVAEEEKEQNEIIAKEEKKQTEISDEDDSIHYIDKIIYDDQKIILTGGESTELSAILSGLGLTGDITDVEVSNPDLLQILNDDGTFYFKSTEPYDTEEWMKVTIDGVEYEIAVLDDAPLEDISNSVTQEGASEFMKFFPSVNTSFNIQGVYNGNFIQTTYGGTNGAGYVTAIKVGDGNKNPLNSFKFGKLYTFDEVQIRITASITENGRAVAIVYDVHNKKDVPVTVRFGSSADTQIGTNDLAKVKFVDNGILMEDDKATKPHSTTTPPEPNPTYGAQFKVYPGEGDFTKKWYGLYSNAYINMFDIENPNPTQPTFKGDSGIAWSWTVNLQPHQTVSKTTGIKVSKTLEIYDCNLTADLENEKMLMTVPYEDKGNLEQTLHYTIDESDDLGGDKKNTNSSVYNSFYKEIDVGPSGLNWAPETEHLFKIWLTNNSSPMPIESQTLNYKVFWAGKTGEDTNLKTLKFYSDSGNLFADVKAQSGTLYPLPSDSMEGYAFKGWSKDAGGTEPWYPGGSNYTILENETIYAIFKKGWKVDFNANGGSFGETSVKTVDVEDGLTVSAPNPEPVRDGYELENWYKEQACINPYDFATPVIKNNELFAKWTPLPATEPIITGPTPNPLVLDYGYSEGNSISVSVTTGSDASYTLDYKWYSCNSEGEELTLLEGSSTDSYTIPIGKDVDNYYYCCEVTATRSDNGESATKMSQIGEVTVVPTEVIVTPPDAKNRYYDGTEQALVAAGSTTGGTMVYAVSKGNDEPDASAYSTYIPEGLYVNIDNSGNEIPYKVWYKVLGTKQYKGTDPVSLDVNICKRNIEITAKDATKTYDGSALTCNSIKEDVDLAEGDTLESVTVEGSQTDVGSSDNTPTAAVIKRDGNDVTYNYNITFVKGILTVTKAKAIVVAPDPNNRTYDGTEQPLVTGGSTTFGSIEYAIGTGEQAPDENAYTIEVPDGKYVDDYTVWYRVKDTDNYSGKDPAPINVNISKKKITITSATDSKTYDGTALTNENYIFDATTLGEGDKLENGSITVTGSQTNVGSSDNHIQGAVIRCEADDDKDVTDNYEINYEKGTLTVTKAKAKVVAPDPNNRTYDGTEQPLVTGGSTTFGSIEYAIGTGEQAPDENAYTIEVPDGKYVDDYTVWYRVKDTDNYSGKDPAPINVNISKKKITITSATDSKTYDGIALANENYIFDATTLGEGDTLENGSVTVTGSQTNVGSSDNHIQGAVIRCEADDDKDVTNNYEITYITGTLTVIRAEATVVAPDPNNRTYDGTEQPLVTGGSTTFGSIEYAIGEEDIAPDEDAFSNEVPDGKYADDYTVWYRVKDTDDYSGKDPSPINIRINKREITITAATDSKTYDGTALTNGNYIFDATTLGEGDTLENGSVTVTGSQTNAGSSGNHIQGAVIKCEADDMDVTNCYEINYTDGTLTVTKAAMTVSAEGYTGVYDNNEHSIIVEVSAPDEAEIYYSTSELNEDNFREGSTNPVQITDVGTTKVYYYVYSDNYEPDHPSGSADIVIEPQPEPAYMYHRNTDEEDYESYSPPNPDALHAWYLIDDNIVPESKIGKAVQGPLAAAIFARARSFLLNSAFSFDLSIKDKTEYTLKKGKIVMYIPEAFQRKGRVFSVLGLDKYGNIHLFTNVGIHENLLTVNVDFEGYAFELVYSDPV